ncbi:MAG: GNAT family N-acetyltransferase [Saprospiraceae bacterium]
MTHPAMTDVTIHTYTPNLRPSSGQFEQISAFLFKALESYGDPLEDIRKAMTYALNLQDVPGRGGLVLTAQDEDSRILGAVVINETGMSGYIPEYILVYIAVDPDTRGMGLGKRLMETALHTVQGGIALHVEPDNPARRLYEKLGFTNKYLEMRFQP